MREATDTIRAAANVLRVATRDFKQLEGEEGTAEEVTEEYRELLILVLLLWITRNKNVRLEDQQAVNNAVIALGNQLEQVAIEELPVAFAMGSGGPVANFGEIAELGALTVENQFFLDGSFGPYMLADLAPTENPLATIGDIAAVRQGAWASRIGLYAGAFWTAIWVGLGAAVINRLLQNTAPTRRLLDPAAEHCGTCPGKALEYGSWNEMLAWTGGLPADGSDDCHCVTTPDSRILTKRGWIPIRNVAVGDRVFTHRGRWRTVLETIISMPRPTHRQAWLLAPNGEWVGCTSDHRWLTAEGWRRTDVIKKQRLSVYNWEYAQRSMSLRKREGYSRSGMSELRDVAQGERAVERSRATQAHSHEYSRSWSQAQTEIRRSLPKTLPQQENGRADLRPLLGWRSQAFNLPLSMGVDANQRTNSRRNGLAPHQSRSKRRPIKESSVANRFGSQETSSIAEQTCGLLLRNLRQGVLENTSQGTPQQILLAGTLLAGTLLYDLHVEEDHSFIIEGLISHNSNCRCQIEVFIEGEWISAGI